MTAEASSVDVAVIRDRIERDNLSSTDLRLLITSARSPAVAIRLAVAAISARDWLLPSTVERDPVLGGLLEYAKRLEDAALDAGNEIEPLNLMVEPKARRLYVTRRDAPGTPAGEIVGASTAVVLDALEAAHGAAAGEAP